MRSDTLELLNPLCWELPRHDPIVDGTDEWPGRNYWTDLC